MKITYESHIFTRPSGNTFFIVVYVYMPSLFQRDNGKMFLKEIQFKDKGKAERFRTIAEKYLNSIPDSYESLQEIADYIDARIKIIQDNKNRKEETIERKLALLSLTN